MPIYGDGKQIRDWLYVEDHCDAIFKVISNADSGQKYNIGSQSELTNIDIVTKICKLMDKYYPSNLNKSYMNGFFRVGIQQNSESFLNCLLQFLDHYLYMKQYPVL